MMSAGEAEIGFAFEEQPFTEVLGRFHTPIADALFQSVAAVLGRLAHEGLAGGEHPQTHFEPITFFTLGAQEGTVDFSQNDLTLLPIPGRDHAVLKDSRLQLIFFVHDLRAGFLHPAVETAVVDGFFHEGPQEMGGLTVGKTGGQGDCLLRDPWAGMLPRLQTKNLIQGTEEASLVISHLPAFQPDPSEAGQHVQPSQLAAVQF